jgi:mRNA deadenylase 3'-5' endonuclease subunit Ccr4
MEWKPTSQPMRSAYAVRQDGKEPDFTNYAARSADEEPFIDTLDYIFLSDDDKWAVSDVLSIPNREDSQGPFPNLDVQEPSDHVMIAATLSYS